MRAWCAGAVVVMACAAVARGGIAPDYDFQWAVIGDPGNAPLPGGSPRDAPFYMRGGVDYEYRISKLEVTSGQWLEFINTIGPLDPAFTVANLEPLIWGGRRDFVFPDGYRYRYRDDAPVPAMTPLNGITWRAAAMYCNWLHNDKAPTLEAIRSGAYDTNTFTLNPDGTINDQRTHSPGAKFWIPTFDEWLKAAHYDPDKNGPGQGGYWEYSTTSDTEPVSGWPEEAGAQTSTGVPLFDENDRFALFVPLGSYPQTTSPWGLLDTSGGATEWMEDWAFGSSRLVDGSRAAGGAGAIEADRAFLASADNAFSPLKTVRIASAIPAPGGVAPLFGLAIATRLRRRSSGGVLRDPHSQGSEQP